MDGPQQEGLYDPRNEHDACGVGFVVNIKNRKSHAIVEQGLQIAAAIRCRRSGSGRGGGVGGHDRHGC